MNVELALWSFPAPVPHVLPGKPNACELHAGGFDSAEIHFCFSRSMEGLA